MHELTGGIPRRVKQLADLALLAGAGRNLVQIEPDTIDSVYHELGVVVPASRWPSAAEFVRRLTARAVRRATGGCLAISR